MKKYLLLLAGLLSAALLLWWAEPRVLLGHIKAFNPAVLAGLCALQLLTIALITWQWLLLASKSGYKLSVLQVLHVIMAGTFTECVTPAVKAGGEAVKVVMLRKAGLPGSTALAVAAGQKLVSSIAFLFLAIISLCWYTLTISLDSGQRTLLLAALVLVTGFTAVLGLVSARPALLLRIPVIARNSKIQQGIAGFRKAFAEMAEGRLHIAGHIVLALIIWLLYAVKALAAAAALGINPGFLTMAAITYLSYLAGMAPIPGGLGAFEGAVVLLLAPVPVAVSAAMALAIFLRLVTFWFPFAVSALWLAVNSLGSRRPAWSKQ